MDGLFALPLCCWSARCVPFWSVLHSYSESDTPLPTVTVYTNGLRGGSTVKADAARDT